MCYWASSLNVCEESAPYSLGSNTLEEGWRNFLRVRAHIVYKFRKKFFYVPMGILKIRIRSLSLPLSIALILMYIIIYNKGLVEE